MFLCEQLRHEGFTEGTKEVTESPISSSRDP